MKAGWIVVDLGARPHRCIVERDAGVDGLVLEAGYDYCPRELVSRVWT